MNVVSTDQVADTIRELHELAKRALAEENTDRFIALERYINETEAYVREVQQSAWTDECRTAIGHLEEGKALTDADKEVLRTFLICDAERYLEHENNFDDWKNELERLMRELVRRAPANDRNALANLRGILHDAIRLVPDIRNYLEEKQRVERFENALNQLDEPSRTQLVRLLKEQLTSRVR